MKIILKERKDYETLIITKKVMESFKKSLIYFNDNRDKNEIKTKIDSELFNQLQNKLPKHFRFIELNVYIDNNIDGFFTNGSLNKIYSRNDKAVNYSSLTLNIGINEIFSYQEYGNHLQAELKSLIRHELEHLYQLSTNIIPSPKDNTFKYYISDEEIDAYVVQLVRYAKNGKHSFSDIFNIFLEDVKSKLEKDHKEHFISRKLFSKSVDRELELIKNKMVKRIKERYPKIII